MVKKIVLRSNVIGRAGFVNGRMEIEIRPGQSIEGAMRNVNEYRGPDEQFMWFRTEDNRIVNVRQLEVGRTYYVD